MSWSANIPYFFDIYGEYFYDDIAYWFDVCGEEEDSILKLPFTAADGNHYDGIFYNASTSDISFITLNPETFVINTQTPVTSNGTWLNYLLQVITFTSTTATIYLMTSKKEDPITEDFEIFREAYLLEGDIFTGKTFIFNNTLSYMHDLSIDTDMGQGVYSFVSNNIPYESLDIYLTDNLHDAYYKDSSNTDTHVYSDGSWTNNNYKTITFIYPIKGYKDNNPLTSTQLMIELLAMADLYPVVTYTTTNTELARIAYAIRAATDISMNLTYPNEYVSIIGTFGMAANNFIQNHAQISQYEANIESIDSGAFAFCHNLTSVNFPNCTTIGSNAFNNCDTLTTISFPKCTAINSRAFYSCYSLQIANFPSCVTISNYAFQYCSELTTASFPTCMLINGYAFANCTKLTTISFPNCTTINNYAFAYCTKLTIVNFPTCRIIDGYAFYCCSSLTTASFPKCRTIGSRVFSQCAQLISLYLLGSSVADLSYSNTFSSTPIAGYTTSTDGVLGSIFVPSSLYSSYISATNWVFYSDRFVSV